MAAYASCFVGFMLVFWLACQISGIDESFMTKTDRLFYCAAMASVLALAVYPVAEAAALYFDMSNDLAMFEPGYRD